MCGVTRSVGRRAEIWNQFPDSLILSCLFFSMGIDPWIGHAGMDPTSATIIWLFISQSRLPRMHSAFPLSFALRAVTTTGVFFTQSAFCLWQPRTATPLAPLVSSVPSLGASWHAPSGNRSDFRAAANVVCVYMCVHTADIEQGSKHRKEASELWISCSLFPLPCLFY